jgi:hypothetical protein
MKPIFSLIVALLLASSGLAQHYGGSLDSDSGLLLTPPQQYFREMRMPDRVRWSDPTIVRLNDGGTGSVIAIEGKPFVASCAHDRDGYVQLGQRGQFQSNTGNFAAGQVVAFDSRNDCSLWMLKANFNAPTLAVASSTPQRGERVRTAGFPMGQQLRDRYTKVISSSDGQMHIRAGAIPGDSGGPVINDRGELCGIVYGGDIHFTDRYGNVTGREVGAMCCGTAPLRKLIDDVAGSVVIQQTQYSCSNGVCRPSPDYWTQPSQPVRQPQPVATGKPCDCAPKWESLNTWQTETSQVFANNNTKIEQQLARIQGVQDKLSADATATASSLPTTVQTTVENYLNEHPAQLSDADKQQIVQAVMLEVNQVLAQHAAENKPPTIDEIVDSVSKRLTHSATITLLDGTTKTQTKPLSEPLEFIQHPRELK